MIKITKEESRPYNCGVIDISCEEMMLHMYMPLLLNGIDSVMMLPTHLKFLLPILSRIEEIDDMNGRYVYATVKHTYVSPKSMTQRMGWHIDGFNTNDINYIWYSEVPTEFAIGEFNLDENDSLSLKQMEEQVKNCDIITYPSKTLLRLAAKEVHRTNENHDYEGLRTFIKITISDHKFNLIGNAKNPLLDYDWKMHSRQKLRNMESNKDFLDE